MGDTQLLFLKSVDRVRGSTSDATFTLHPPIPRGGKWKALSFSMLSAIGPLNNTSIDVEFTTTTSNTLYTQGPPYIPIGARTYKTTKYPATLSPMQPTSLYDDVMEWRPVTPLFDVEKDILQPPSPTITPSYWLLNQFTPPGFSETNNGAFSMSAASQLATLIQQSIRIAIAEGMGNRMNNAQLRFSAEDPGSLKLEMTANNFFYVGSVPVGSGASAWQPYTTVDTNVVDFAKLFHIVPPGATVSHLNAHGDTKYVVTPPPDPVEFTDIDFRKNMYRTVFTNRTNRWAFIMFWDPAFGVSRSSVLPPPLNDPDYSGDFPPWPLDLKFKINGTIAYLFGLEPNRWQKVAVPPNRFTENAFWNQRFVVYPPSVQIFNEFKDRLNYFETYLGKEFATYAPTGLVPAPPTLLVELSLLTDHQTRSAKEKMSRVAMAIPLPASATDVIQYTNSSIDWSSQMRQERISEISVRLTNWLGEELNSEKTLPPGVESIEAFNSAGLPTTPDWTMEIAFESSAE
jgi:hypothetical protein